MRVFPGLHPALIDDLPLRDFAALVQQAARVHDRQRRERLVDAAYASRLAQADATTYEREVTALLAEDGGPDD